MAMHALMQAAVRSFERAPDSTKVLTGFARSQCIDTGERTFDLRSASRARLRRAVAATISEVEARHGDRLGELSVYGSNRPTLLALARVEDSISSTAARFTTTRERSQSA